MNNKLILTGVTGPKSGGIFIMYISKHMEKISRLFPGGISVICRETSRTEQVETLIPSAHIFKGSFSDSRFMDEAMISADTVVHIAGIHYSKQVVDSAVRGGCRRLVLVHTTGIYSKYKKVGEEYRKIDAYVEQYCQKYNIVLTILRPTMIYGNISDANIVEFIRMVDKLPIMPVVNGGKYKLQPVYYKDLGKAYFDVLIHEEKTGGRNYILSGGEVIYLCDIFTVIGENLGKKVKFISCPYWLAYYGACIIYGLSLKRIDYREKVQRLCESRTYNYEDASRDFGYAPRTFRMGIGDEVEEYVDKCKNKR